MSEAKIKIDNEITGTAWLVHSENAITAAHCVGARGTSVELLFENPITGVYDVSVSATVLVRSAVQDGALLQLSTAMVGIPVLSVIKSNPHLPTRWQARGFPAVAVNYVHLFEARGTVGVETRLVQNGNPPVIQLNLDYASSVSEERIDAETGAVVHALAGMSGAAVRVHGGLEDGRVIAVIRCSVGGMPQDIIYATPIEALWEEFVPYIQGVDLHEWRRTTGSVRSGPAAHAVISNIDEDLITAAWGDDMVKDITVDLPWDEAGQLISAILRVVLHQPGIARLHVRNPRNWNQRLRRYADGWIALAQFNPEERVDPAIECSQTSNDGGVSYPSASSAAAAIHEACDRFVLRYLHERLTLMFEAPQPRDYATFNIAPDVLAHMEDTWRIWREQLNGDAALLHHYLALMLTHQGAYDCTMEPSPGAGRLTMKECVLPATIFGLAIAPFLPNAFAPKRPNPGNIGAEQFSGHSCGILAVKRERLDVVLRDHQWTTQVVLLQSLPFMPPEWQAATSTLLSGGGLPRPTLTRPAPSALIITCDSETLRAIGTGVQALKEHLASRHADQIQIQEGYVTSAAPQL